ncbi:Actin-related protein 4 [Rhodotorula toruloides]|nr:Actin-related protein 4 [Rhodotorula toruloides]
MSYAGEDAPKCLFPTAFATVPSSDPSQPPTYVHGNNVHLYRPHATVSSFVADQIVTDWDAAGRALEHAFQDRMRVKTLEEFPLMATEPSWNTKENKEKMCELAFETWQTPAFYSVDKAVMSAFAAGKGSALIVNVGEELTTVTPVYDGFVLRKAIQKQPTGGALLSEVLLSSLKSQSLPVTPHYLVKTKEAVEPNQPANAQLREDRLPNPSDPNAATTPSYHRLEEMRLMHELKESVCEVMTPSWDDNSVNQKASRAFEFPDGFNTYLGTVRLSTPEIIFNPQRFLPVEFKNRQLPPSASTIPSHPYSALQPLAGLIRNTLIQVDPDLQATLLANVVVTGGTTLIPGFVDRLQAELGIVAPGMKIKIHAAASAAERTHSSWLGGSILASLGTFHQLWIGKDEYQEVGKSVVHRRAKLLGPFPASSLHLLLLTRSAVLAHLPSLAAQMEVPDQGHSLFLLDDPSKRAFISIDGKPVPVFLTRQEGQRRVTGSIKGVPGQTFHVAFWDGRKKSSKYGRNVELFFGEQWIGGWYASNKQICTEGASDDINRFDRWEKKAGRPFQFAKLPTTDDSAVACSDTSKINELNCIRVVYKGIKGIKKRKKEKKRVQASKAKEEDPLREQQSVWKELGAVNERSDKGQFGLTPSFGARLDGGTSTPVAQVETAEPEYETTYTYVADTDIEFVFYIRSSAWIDRQINAEPGQKAVMPKGAVAADGAIYLDHDEEEVEKDVQLAKSRPAKRPKTSHAAGDDSHLPADGDTFFREATSFSETDDDSDDDDLSPQQLARTLHQNPQLYALIKAAAKGGTVTLPPPTPELASSTFAGHSASGIAITQRRSADEQQNEFEADEEGPVAGGSGVGAAGATQVGEEWRGGV